MEPYADASVVRDAELVCKSQHPPPPPRFVPSDKVVASLVFVAGPNAGCSQRPKGSTARTLNVKAIADYNFFRDSESIEAALRAGLDAMIDENLTIALVARVSCGIYAGPNRHRVIAEFLVIVNELLCKPLRSPSSATSPGGSHFRLVIVPGLL